MNRTRAIATLLVVCAGTLWPGIAQSRPSRPGKQPVGQGAGVAKERRSKESRSVIQTFPAIPGMRYRLHGRVRRADARGRLTLPGVRHPQRQVKVLRTKLGSGVQARFSRWYADRGMVTVARFYRVRLRYAELSGEPVDPARVQTATVRGTHGVTYTFSGSAGRWLQGSRVVQNINGGFESKGLEYAVDKVLAGGSDIVNSAQQRFSPRRTRVVTVRLLLFSALVTTKDSFFGFPIGSAVRLRFPDGHVERRPLGPNGRVTLRSLPRGEYMVSVDGPGFSFERPVALSRDQDVELKVLSYLDVGLVAGAVLAFLIGLPLIRRWLTRTRAGEQELTLPTDRTPPMRVGAGPRE